MSAPRSVALAAISHRANAWPTISSLASPASPRLVLGHHPRPEAVRSRGEDGLELARALEAIAHCPPDEAMHHDFTAAVSPHEQRGSDQASDRLVEAIDCRDVCEDLAAHAVRREEGERVEHRRRQPRLAGCFDGIDRHKDGRGHAVRIRVAGIGREDPLEWPRPQPREVVAV